MEKKNYMNKLISIHFKGQDYIRVKHYRFFREIPTKALTIKAEIFYIYVKKNISPRIVYSNNNLKVISKLLYLNRKSIVRPNRDVSLEHRKLMLKKFHSLTETYADCSVIHMMNYLKRHKKLVKLDILSVIQTELDPKYCELFQNLVKRATKLKELKFWLGKRYNQENEREPIIKLMKCIVSRNLEHLTFHTTGSILQQDIVLKYLSESHIKTLDFKFSERFQNDEMLIDSETILFPNLKKLVLDLTNIDRAHFLRCNFFKLGSLRSLSLRFGQEKEFFSKTLIIFFSSITEHLEDLEISCALFSSSLVGDMLYEISNASKLKVFGLEASFDTDEFDHIARLNKRNTRLESLSMNLHLCNSNSVSINNFFESLSNSKNLKSLILPKNYITLTSESLKFFGDSMQSLTSILELQIYLNPNLLKSENLILFFKKLKLIKTIKKLDINFEILKFVISNASLTELGNTLSELSALEELRISFEFMKKPAKDNLIAMFNLQTLDSKGFKILFSSLMRIRKILKFCFSLKNCKYFSDESLLFLFKAIEAMLYLESLEIELSNTATSSNELHKFLQKLGSITRKKNFVFST